MGIAIAFESRAANLKRPRFYTAYEFSKRKFAKKYGDQLPVWTLLASGSTGGVRLLRSILLGYELTKKHQISYWLACYPLGSSVGKPPQIHLLTVFRHRCGQITGATSQDAPSWDSCTIYRTRTQRNCCGIQIVGDF